MSRLNDRKAMKNATITVLIGGSPRILKFRGYCPCGAPAFRKYTGSLACESCITIEKRMSYETAKVGIKTPDREEVDFYETGEAAS